MGSICPRSFLFVIIQGINLVYSPQEPVAVALALPAKSLDTQSVGTKQQLGLSRSCQLNRGAEQDEYWQALQLIFGAYVQV